LPHDNVIRIFDHGQTEHCAWMAMEHAAGGDLTERIRRGLSPREALALLRQAAEGLWQLHRQGVVHRDVKPANLLLRTRTQLMVADFGLAQRQDEHDPAPQDGLMVGTPRYAAPEQAQGDRATPAADIYSLGVVFHEMLCGKPPFSGQTLTEVISQNLVADVPALPRGLAALQPLMDAMLAKPVSGRLADGRAVLEQIEAIGASGIQTLQPRAPERGV
jgi:serine/threonine protein kinase